MSIKTYLSACTAAVVLSSGAAVAGGIVAPVIEAAPIEVAPVAIAGAWQGAYAGGSLGYSFLGDDEVGFDLFTDGTPGPRLTDVGSVEVKGVTAGAHVGYRWQRNNWVFGPELGIEGGSVDASDDVLEATVESEVNYVATLVMKTGYEMTPGTLVYGTAGLAYGDFDYIGTIDGESQSVGYSNTGYALGLGVERMMNDRVSVFAEYQYRNFGNETVTFDLDGATVDTRATPTHSNVKVGANFKF